MVKRAALPSYGLHGGRNWGTPAITYIELVIGPSWGDLEEVNAPLTWRGAKSLAHGRSKSICAESMLAQIDFRRATDCPEAYMAKLYWGHSPVQPLFLPMPGILAYRILVKSFRTSAVENLGHEIVMGRGSPDAIFGVAVALAPSMDPTDCPQDEGYVDSSGDIYQLDITKYISDHCYISSCSLEASRDIHLHYRCEYGKRLYDKVLCRSAVAAKLEDHTESHVDYAYMYAQKRKRSVETK